MSKNLTRKGLAFGALVALGSTVIAGAPAFAADPVALAPSSGTSYNTILGESLVLQSLFTDAQQQGAESLKFRIVDSSKKLGLSDSGLDSETSTTDRTVNTAANDNAGTNLTANDGIYVVTGGSTVGPSKNFLVLKADSAATATFSVTVQSWMDFNNDNIVDSTEASSAVQTVKFVKASEVTSATTIAAVLEGDTTISASVAFNDINNEQLPAANVGVYFTKGDGSVLKDANGSDLAAGAADVKKSNVAWSASDKFKFTTSTIGALAKSTAVKAQPIWKSAGSPAHTDTIGTAATLDVVARKIATVTADVVRSSQALPKNTGYASVSAEADTAFVLRNGTFKFKVTAKDNATTPAAVAGAAVKVTITTSAVLGTLSTDKSITVNGTAYTAVSALPGASGVATIATTTDADGVAYVEVKTTNFAVDDTVTASFVAENFTRTVAAKAKDAVYAGVITNRNGIATTVDGTAVAVNVKIQDQFGGLPANSTYDARALFVSSSQTTAATNGSNVVAVAVVDGLATLNILDNGTGTGTNVYDVEFIKKDTVNGGYGSNTATDIDSTFDIKIVSATDATAGSVKLYTASGGSTEQGKNTAETAYAIDNSSNALSTATFANYSAVSPLVGSEPTQTATAANIYAKVASASTSTYAGVAIAGADVTVAGAGLLFKDNNAAVYGVGSLTVQADANGYISVSVWSQKAGTQTVTVTSGAAKATAEVKFAAAAATAGTTLTVTAPATIEPGKTLTVSAVLTDKFGNAVDVADGKASVAYDGPGLRVDALPTQTDADGKLQFRVLLGATDTGAATATIKIDTNADGDFTDTTDITKTASIAIAAPVVVVPEVKTTIVGVTKALRVRVENAKGEEVEIVVGGKTVRVAIAGTNSKLWVINTTKGKKSVKVYVDGDLVAVKTVTVK